MKKNSFLDRMAAKQEAEKLAVLRFTRQLMMDCTAVALNNLYGFGAERIKATMDEIAKVYGDYADMWNSDTADTEYSREKMDQKLAQICGEYFAPWEERYAQR